MPIVNRGKCQEQVFLESDLIGISAIYLCLDCVECGKDVDRGLLITGGRISEVGGICSKC